MFVVRPLPRQGEQLPHPVKWVKAGQILCVRCLDNPLLIQGHWQKEPPRSMPCWGEWCQFCAMNPPLPEKELAFICGSYYLREEFQKPFAAGTERDYWVGTACIVLPADPVKEMCQRPEYGHHWRGLVLDVFHVNKARTSPVSITEVKRQDPAKWPTSWDLRADLLHLWREHLPADPEWRRNLYGREPGQEG